MPTQAPSENAKETVDGGFRIPETGVFVSEYNKKIFQATRMPERVKILDTTLRDGEQTPNVALSSEDKLKIAQALDELGVDIIEAGFPINSEGEAEAVKKIAGDRKSTRLNSSHGYISYAVFCLKKKKKKKHDKTRSARETGMAPRA